MVTVALIGQQLHLIIFIITHAITKHGKINPRFAFLLYQPYHFIIAAGTYVKVAIGSKDNPVIPSFNEMFAADFIGQLNSFTTCSGSAGFEIVDRSFDSWFIFSTGLWQYQPGISGINYNGYAVAITQLIHQHFHGCLYKR